MDVSPVFTLAYISVLFCGISIVAGSISYYVLVIIFLVKDYGICTIIIYGGYVCDNLKVTGLYVIALISFYLTTAAVGLIFLVIIFPCLLAVCELFKRRYGIASPLLSEHARAALHDDDDVDIERGDFAVPMPIPNSSSSEFKKPTLDLISPLLYRLTTNGGADNLETAANLTNTGSEPVKWRLDERRRGWVRMDFKTPQLVDCYGLCSADDHPSFDPRIFELQGRATLKGENWVTLHSEDSCPFSDRLQWVWYDLPRPMRCVSLRLFIHSNRESGYSHQLSRFYVTSPRKSRGDDAVGEMHSPGVNTERHGWALRQICMRSAKAIIRSMQCMRCLKECMAGYAKKVTNIL